MSSFIEPVARAWEIISGVLYWASLGTLVVVGLLFLFLMRYRLLDIISWMWPAWVYDRSKRKTRFTRREVGYLFRKGIVGYSGNKWYFFGDSSVEIARKALEVEAKQRAEDRQKDYERRPRWNWEIKEHPEFDVAMKIADRIFKFFQWIIVAVAMQALGKRTQEPILSAVGSFLGLVAATPYVILLSQSLLALLHITPESGGRYMVRRFLLVVVIMLSATIVFVEYMTYLTEALVAVQLSAPNQQR